jgi:hypothetical protein
MGFFPHQGRQGDMKQLGMFNKPVNRMRTTNDKQDAQARIEEIRECATEG